METATLTFFVNGGKVEDKNANPEWSLAWYLREKLRLTGTKISCEEGQCGSCTVALAKICPETGKPRYLAVNACLLSVGQVHGCAITTVEGIGSTKTGLHPTQERIAKGHGSQCGFCTPGFAMSMYALLKNHPEPTHLQIEQALEGNLCRCTGYRPILEAYQTFTKDVCCTPGGQCCKGKKMTAADGWSCCQLTDYTAFKPYNSAQDPIFPPELQMNHAKYSGEYLKLTGSTTTFHRPTTMAKLSELVKQHPNAQLISSGALHKYEHRYPTQPNIHMITVASIPELRQVSQDGKGLILGAGIHLFEMEEIVDSMLGKLNASQSSVLRGMKFGLHSFSSQQIKNFGTWVGNVGAGHSSFDLVVLFLGAKCQLEVLNCANGQRRWVDVDQSFYTGSGRLVNLAPSEIISSCRIPFTDENQFFCYTKHTTRRGYGVSLVNLAAWVEFDQPGSNVVKDMRLAYGNMAKKPLLASNTAKSLIGKKFDDQLLEEACNHLAAEMKLPAEASRAKYRTSLCLSLFFKFHQCVKQWLQTKTQPPCHDEYQPMRFTQNIEDLSVLHRQQPPADPVGKPLPHSWADRHATGEALFSGDEKAEGMTHVAPVISDRAHAKLVSMDYSEALKFPGVITYVDAKDIPPKGTNNPTDFMCMDETVFAVDEVRSVGQTIGAIVAEDSNTARQAAKLVKITYQDLPVIVTIQDAIKANSYIGEPEAKNKGDVDKALAESAMVISGHTYMASQEHVYLETQCTLAIPKEEEWDIYCSAQSKSMAHSTAAQVLGVPSSKVNLITKRLGGAFGGKLSMSSRALWPAVVAAEKVRRPAKCFLTRAEDLRMTGKRHPAYAEFKVGVTKEGKINAMDVQVYTNGGYTSEQSVWCMQHVVHRLCHCYFIPHVKIIGRACSTNLPSNTAFRGYGVPQASYIMDCILEKVAETLGQPPEKVRELNFLKKGDKTMDDVTITDTALQETWAEAIRASNFMQLKKEVHDFNSKNQLKKRGVAIVPMRFCIGAKDMFIEQGAALVHIYIDGSVVVTHGGSEMGQGLNIKILQVASRVLNRPIETITTVESASDKVPNPTVTGGSMGSDVHGPAVKNACETLLKRLEPIMKANPNGTWEEWIQAAFFSRISLSATGFGIPTSSDDIKPGQPRNAVCGVTCSMVEVDCLTGDHELLSTDLFLSLPDSINPAIDLTQYEGAFIQGYGLYTWEDWKYDNKGQLVNGSLSAYKIPSVATVPRRFRAFVIKKDEEKYNIYGSRGIGEIGFYTGAAPYWAIRDALRSYRAERGLPPMEFESPATGEVIRMACEDKFTKAV